MERYLFVLIILFITVGLFITVTSKIKCENFNDFEREVKLLNRNIDFINQKCSGLGYENSLSNILN